MPTANHNVFLTDHAPGLFARVAHWVEDFGQSRTEN
jgi:hypothetical protein